MQWDWFSAPEYQTARWTIQHLVALTYLIAFVAAMRQFRGLLGSTGLTPIPKFLQRARFREAPSLFHVHYSDRFFVVVCVAGAVLSGAVLGGVIDVAPVWTGVLLWLAIWILYLSIVNVGQRWYSFGWESLLLEAGFLTAFLGPADVAAPVPILCLLIWLLFRLEVGAGLIKLRGDRCWRNLTCLDYHHETQPLPGPSSWWFHHLPRPMHRVEVLANHVTQLIVPFGLVAPQPVASLAAAIILVTQGWLMASGNYAWLNLLTMSLALGAIEDDYLRDVLPVPLPQEQSEPADAYVVVVFAVTGLMVALAWWPIRNMVSRRQLMNAGITPLHLGNTYGAFGSVTRRRRELILEGTEDRHIRDTTVWREYEFRGKPGDPRRRPRQVAPYHLRLDWLMWFAAISPHYALPWFPRLVEELLRGNPAVLNLLHTNPFPDAPPTFVRATLYSYRFSTRAERRYTGNWWHREPLVEFMAPQRLRGSPDRASETAGDN